MLQRTLSKVVTLRKTTRPLLVLQIMTARVEFGSVVGQHRRSRSPVVEKVDTLARLQQELITYLTPQRYCLVLPPSLSVRGALQPLPRLVPDLRTTSPTTRKF